MPRKLTVHEVLSALEDEEFFEADIFIEPPADLNYSDEDSADEEHPSINNFSARQLNSFAEATIRHGIIKKTISNDSDCDSVLFDDAVDSSNNVQLATLDTEVTSSLSQNHEPQIKKCVGKTVNRTIKASSSNNNKKTEATINKGTRSSNRNNKNTETKTTNEPTKPVVTMKVGKRLAQDSPTQSVTAKRSNVQALVNRKVAATTNKANSRKQRTWINRSISSNSGAIFAMCITDVILWLVHLSVSLWADRKLLQKRVPDAIRKHGQHYISASPTQRRCAMCGLKVRKLCRVCNVALHMECFSVFHT